RKILDAYAIDALNFLNNMPRWLDGDTNKAFVLFPQGPKGISKSVGPMVIEHVGKLQDNILERLVGFRGLFGFSRQQHNRMMELHRRLGQLGAGVKYFGLPVRWDQAAAERNYDIDYVRAAWDDLLPLIGFQDDHRNSAFLRAMRLWFRFVPWLCPQFASAKLPPRTDSKGTEIMEYFGQTALGKKPAA
ncbi:MAG TPA: hypothetical protein VH518_15705, partial [Tepidisphaeraceae bacterium]